MLVFVTTVVTVATHHGSGNDNDCSKLNALRVMLF